MITPEEMYTAKIQSWKWAAGQGMGFRAENLAYPLVRLVIVHSSFGRPAIDLI